MRLAIATLVDGSPETAMVHMQPMIQRASLGGVRVLDPGYAIGSHMCGNTDVSRGRDRLARIFLEQCTDCTHLLWWDEDVLANDLQVISRMLSTGFDFVSTAYPRKKYPISFSYRLEGADGEAKRVELTNHCVEVDAISFGFTITSRSCLQRMINAYADTRWYYDIFDNNAHRTVGLFDLIYTPVRKGPTGQDFRVKLSEDYSFCESWRSIGGKVWMYVGDGDVRDTLGHIGSHVFTGGVEVIGE